jgi:hypothetical protein
MLAERGMEEAFDAVAQNLPGAASPVMSLPWLHIAGLSVSVIIFGITLGYFLASRKGMFI